MALVAARDMSDRFAGGAVLVDLSPLRDARQVISAIADAFGVRQGGSLPVQEILERSIAECELLLALDNFEHVLSAAPDLASSSRYVPRCGCW